MTNLQQKLMVQHQLQLPLLGLSTATGMSALNAMNAGIDFIMILNSGKFRQMGRSSLAGYLPFINSNQQIQQIATQEILPVAPKAPCILGINATDPQLNFNVLLNFLHQHNLAGVVNYPTVSLIDGQFREGLTEAGITFEQELDFLHLAHQAQLLTVAFVTNSQEALAASSIPTDIICIHLGLTAGGRLGANRITSFENMIRTTQDICTKLEKARSTSLIMIYGGVLNNLTEVRYMYNLLPNLAGYIGGSTFERIIPEQTIMEQIKAFKHANVTTNDALTNQILQQEQPYVDPIVYIKEYITQHYSEPIYLADFAQTLHLSKNYLSSLFKQRTHQTFTNYLIEYRLNKAIELMHDSPQTLTNIAAMVGYADYAQFNKTFKKYFHLSPRTYQSRI